ncbi:MAG: hypothetical protein JXB48_10950 [Candidatus Latescibacteria bacterium]|nr:hypothetical protein [Candidatus Latescibacterota bacterium]
MSIRSKINIYLPVDIASIITEDASATNSKLSMFVSFKLLDGFRELKKYVTYSEVAKIGKYKAALKTFYPTKRGKNKTVQEKKVFTFRFSDEIKDAIHSIGERYAFCNSSVVELALRIAYNKLFESQSFSNIVFSENDAELLRKIMKLTGASTVTELLNACQYKESVKVIKEYMDAT